MVLDILLPFGEAQQKYHFLFALKETEAPEVASRPTAETGLEPEPQPPAEAGEAVLRGWQEGTEGAEVEAQSSSPFLCPPLSRLKHWGTNPQDKICSRWACGQSHHWVDQVLK